MTFSRIALIAVAVVAMASGFGPAFAIGVRSPKWLAI
jgi:hypothetical protein